MNLWNPQPIQAMANLIPIGSQTILTNLLHASFEASAPNEVSDQSLPHKWHNINGGINFFGSAMQLGQTRVWNIFFRGDVEPKIQKKKNWNMDI